MGFSVNSVMTSLNLTSSDTIICMSTAYPMVKNVLGLSAARVVQVELDVSLDIAGQISTVLENDGPFTICIVSHITSVPALEFPVEKIIKLCRAKGTKGK